MTWTLQWFGAFEAFGAMAVQRVVPLLKVRGSF